MGEEISPSDETKKKMSNSAKKWIKNNGAPMDGKHHSDELKNKISFSNRGLNKSENNKYSGVRLERNKYRVRMKVNGELQNFGVFENEEDAAIMHDLISIKLFGNNVRLNFDEKRNYYIKNLDKLINEINNKRFDRRGYKLNGASSKYYGVSKSNISSIINGIKYFL